MATVKDIELLIKARDQATPTLVAIGKRLDDVGEAQKDFATSTGLAAKSQKELDAQAALLLSTLAELKKQVGNVEAYKAARQAAADLSQQLDTQKQRLREIAIDFVASDKPMSAFAANYKAAKAAIDQTESSLRRNSATVTTLAGTLERAGISIAALGTAERNLDGFVRQTTAAYDANTDAQQRRAAAISEVQRREASLAAEIKSRNVEAIVGLDRENDRRQQLARDNERRLKKQEDSYAVFSKLLDNLERQEVATEVEARRQADLTARKREQLAREETAREQARRRNKIADATFAFSNATPEQLRTPQDRNTVLINQRRAEIEADQRSIGIKARLAEAEQRLIERRRQLGSATGEATGKNNAFNRSLAESDRNGKTALSIYQRLRGEVLSLTAGYVGLFGSINLVNRAIQASAARDTIRAQLEIANKNDALKAADDYEYLRQIVFRLGLDFESTAQGYAKLRVAGEAAGKPVEVTRKIFEGFAKTLAVVGASQERSQRLFTALEQIQSKGTITAEDYNNQIGDALTGALQKGANALNITVAQFKKLQEQGLSADFLLLFAEEYEKSFGPKAESAAARLVNQFNRLKLAFEDFLVQVLNGGLGEVLSEYAQKLTAFFRSDEGKKFAQSTGVFIRQLADAVVFLVENIKSIGVAFVALKLASVAVNIGLVVKQAGSLGLVLSTINALLGTSIPLAAGSAGTAIRGLLASTGPIGALLALAATGITIAVVIKRRQEEEANLKAGASGALVNGNKLVGDLSAVKTENELSAVQERVAAAVDELKKDIAENERLLVTQRNRQVELRAIALRDRNRTQPVFNNDDIDATLARINALRGTLAGINTNVDAARGRIAQTETDIVAAETKRLQELAKGLAGQAGQAAAAKKAEQAADLLDRLKKKTEDISSALAGTAVETVESATAKITAEIEKSRVELLSIRRDAQRLGAESVVALADRQLGRLESLKTAQIAEATRVIDERRADLLDKASAAIEDFNEKLGDSTKRSLDAAYEAIDAEIAKRRIALENIKRELLVNGETGKAADIDATIKGLDTVLRPRLRANAELADQNQKIKAGEEAINALLAERALLVQTDNDLREAGLAPLGNLRDSLLEYDIQLRDALLLQQDFIAGLDPNNPEVERALITLARLTANAQKVRTAFSEGENRVIGIVANNISSGIEDAAASLGEFVKGAKDAGDVFQDFGQIALSVLSGILREIAVAIIQQQILNLVRASAGAGGVVGVGVAGAGAAVGSNHTGGLAGQGARRVVNPLAFVGAGRFHSGGLPGLAPNEVATILERGEEVLTRQDTRNVLNGGKAAQSDTKILNLFDRDSLAEHLVSAKASERVILNIIRKNSGSIKQSLR